MRLSSTGPYLRDELKIDSITWKLYNNSKSTPEVTKPVIYNSPRLQIPVKTPSNTLKDYICYFQSDGWQWFQDYEGGQYFYYIGLYYGGTNNVFKDGLVQTLKNYPNKLEPNSGGTNIRCSYLYFSSSKNTNKIDILENNLATNHKGQLTENNYLGIKLKNVDNPILLEKNLLVIKEQKKKLETQIS